MYPILLSYFSPHICLYIMHSKYIFDDNNWTHAHAKSISNSWATLWRLEKCVECTSDKHRGIPSSPAGEWSKRIRAQNYQGKLWSVSLSLSSSFPLAELNVLFFPLSGRHLLLILIQWTLANCSDKSSSPRNSLLLCSLLMLRIDRLFVAVVVKKTQQSSYLSVKSNPKTNEFYLLTGTALWIQWLYSAFPSSYNDNSMKRTPFWTHPVIAGLRKLTTTQNETKNTKCRESQFSSQFTNRAFRLRS